MQPIWKDYFVDLGTGISAEYTIQNSSGDVIFAGKAYRRPDEDTITIKINDVCANYLNNKLPNLNNLSAINVRSISETFMVFDASNTRIATITFINDWSYNYDYNAETSGAADPITAELDNRQPLLYTQYYIGTIDVILTMADGSTTTVQISNEYSGDFNASYNLDFLKGQSGTIAVILENYPNVVNVQIGSYHYKVVQGCEKYLIYYLNSYGGWDSLLCKGTIEQTDKYTKHTHKREYDNSEQGNRGTINYLTEIEQGMTLHTGWLSDEQAQKMHHLLGSVDAYLYDIANRVSIPILITNSQCVYKTYKGEGNKPVYYDITVTLAQDRIRR